MDEQTGWQCYVLILGFSRLFGDKCFNQGRIQDNNSSGGVKFWGTWMCSTSFIVICPLDQGSSTGGMGPHRCPQSYYRVAAKSLCDRNFVFYFNHLKPGIPFLRGTIAENSLCNFQGFGVWGKKEQTKFSKYWGFQWLTFWKYTLTWIQHATSLWISEINEKV